MSRIPDVTVMELSDIEPGYARETKVTKPSGVTPKSTFTVFLPL